MTGAWVTFQKELFSYCISPASWLIAVLFYFFRGFELMSKSVEFAAYQLDQDLYPTSTYGFTTTYLIVVLVPGILTMRAFAEERRTGSLETLVTAPVSDAAIVFGKWAAAVAFYLLLWLPTALLLLVLQADVFLGAGLAFGPVFAAYLGLCLWAAMLLAFGCFASSLTDNLLLAAILSMLFSAALLIGPFLLNLWLGAAAENYYVAELIRKLDVMANFRDWFSRGLIDTSQIAFYVGGTLFFLFLTTVSLQARRVA
ncbi:MAG: ABC transporter permease [Planctomycetes bacterium]|nr:ABC transporter permease [Planctomycetota bacterium]